MQRMGRFLLALVGITVIVAGSSTPPMPPDVVGQLPQIGNGYVAAFVNKSTQYVAGVFNGHATHSTRAGIPATTRVFLVCALPRVHDLAAFPFDLDQRTATVSLSGICTAENIAYKQIWYAHRGKSHRGALVTEIHVSNRNPHKNVTLSLTAMPTNMTDYANVRRVLARTGDDGARLDVFATLVPEYASVAHTHSIATATTKVPATVLLPAGNTSTLVVRIVTMHVTNLPDEDGVPAHATNDTLAQLAHQRLNNTMAVGPEALYAQHVAEWNLLWQHAIATDSPSSRGVIEAAQYGILSSLRDDWPYSTSPGGLSTDGYNGHTFWDMETWVNPNMMLLHPTIATGSGFKYRFNRLAGAKENARHTLGIAAGAAFPWESAYTGEDVCPAPLFALTELHVTADLVGAVRQYFRLTKDIAFLQKSWPTLNETSQFWIRRTTAMTAGHGPVHLKNVTGPDEYHQGTDSVYTNYAVQQAVNFTLEAADILGIPRHTIPHAAVFERLVQNITLLYDAKKNYHPEYAGYNGSMVKQADVILLQYPWMMPMAPSTARNDLVYYANRTVPNRSGASTMTWSMFAVGFLALGDVAEGMRYFYEGFQTNSFPPYWQWYQALNHSGNDNFITGAGGFLQSVWAGWGGMRITRDGITVDLGIVALPPDATSLNITGLHYMGGQFSLRYAIKANVATLRVAMERAPPAEFPRICASIAAQNKTVVMTHSGVALAMGWELGARTAGIMVLQICPQHVPDTPAPAPSPPPPSSHGMKKWKLALIIAGGIVAAVVILHAVHMGHLLRKRRRFRNEYDPIEQAQETPL